MLQSQLKPLIQYVFSPFLHPPLGFPHILAFLASCCFAPSFAFSSDCSNLLFKSWSLIYISLFLYAITKALRYAFSMHAHRQVHFFFNAPLKIDTFPVIYLFIYLFPTRHFYPTIPVFLLPRGFIFLLAKKEKLGEDVMQVWAVQRPL